MTQTHNVEIFFSRVEAGLRRVRLGRDSLIFLLGLSVLTLLTLAWVRFVPMTAGGVSTLRLVWGLSLIAGVIVILGRWLFQPVADEQVRAFVRDQDPSLGDLLLTARSLATQDRQGPFNPAFVEAILANSDQQVTRLGAALSFRELLPTRLFRGAAGAVIVAAMTAGLLFPDGTYFVWRLVAGNPVLPQPLPVTFHVQGPQTALPVGESAVLTVRVNGPAGEFLTVKTRQDGFTGWKSRLVPLDGGAATGQPVFTSFADLARPLSRSAQATVRLDDLERTVRVQLEAGSSRSRVLEIPVHEPPRITALELQVTPPAYLGEAPTTFSPLPTTVEVPEGSRLRLRGDVAHSADLAALQLLDPDGEGDVLDLAFADQHGTSTFDVNLTVGQSGRTFQVLAEDVGGLQNRPLRTYRIEVRPDNSPSIAFTQPGTNIEIPESMNVRLELEAEDDRGVRKISIYAKLERYPEEELVESWEFADPEAVVRVGMDWDLSQIDLLPEDVLSYHAVVWDTYEGPRAIDTQEPGSALSDRDIQAEAGKFGRSGTYLVRFPSLEEMYADVTGEGGMGEEDLEEILAEQQSLFDQAEESLTEVLASQETGEQGFDQEKMEVLLDRQKQLIEKGKEAIGEIQQDLNKLMEEELVSIQIAQKVQELQGLLQEVMSEDMRQAMEQLQQLAERIDLTDEQRKELLENFTSSKMLESLERTVESLKTFKEQMKFDALGELAQRIADRQQDLAFDTELAGMLPEGEERAAAERAIEAEQQKLKQDTEKLKERAENMLAETQDEQLRETLRETIDAFEEGGLQEMMEQTQANLQQGNMEQAMQQQQQMGEQMQQMAEQLQQQNQQMFTDEYSAAVDALQQAFHEGVFQSRSLERVSSGLAGLSYDMLQESPRYKERVGDYSSRVRLTRESLTSIRGRLTEIAISSPYLDPEIIKHLDKANSHLDTYLGDLGDQGMVAQSPRINEANEEVRLALLGILDSQDVLQQMAQAMSMEQMMQQLGQISREQRSLNQQTRRMMGGAMPMPMPSPEQMALQQQALGMQLQRLQQQGGQEGQDQIMGDLGKMSEEMEEISEQIQRGEINDELLEKQERLYHRLLDAQKAIKRQGYKKQRKAEQPDDPALAADPPPLEVQEPERRRFQLDDTTDDVDIPEKYRELMKAFYRALSKRK